MKRNAKRIGISIMLAITMLFLTCIVSAAYYADYSSNPADGTFTVTASLQGSTYPSGNAFRTVYATNRFDNEGSATVTKLYMTIDVSGTGLYPAPHAEGEVSIGNYISTGTVVIPESNSASHLYGSYTAYILSTAFYYNPPAISLSCT